MKLEDLQANAAVRGILSDGLVTVVSVQWFGSEALELTYKTPTGKVANEFLYRHDELRLEIVEVGRPWSFDGDGALFRLVSEAQRIRLAHLFDPVLAVHTSVVEPLPHQITAVYESMLPRQPLRFLLADDPGAGKTIMAGLLIKELIARGDLQRCLVVCPGSLAEQWQDELYRRFQLPFDILTNDKLEAARTGNWFLETNLVIARLDKLSRNEDVQQKLQVPDCRWDLVVCDEAHKMSATFFGGEVKYTKRYRLGQLLSTLTRHFLLMTATPHNGKEEDFQLFMALCWTVTASRAVFATAFTSPMSPTSCGGWRYPQGGRAPEVLDHSRMRAHPVRELLRRRRFGVGVAAGAEHGHKQLDRPDLAGTPVDDRRSLAGEVDEGLLAGAMHLAHRRAEPAGPLPVQHAELAVAVPLRIDLRILFPEQLQGHPRPGELAMDLRKCRRRTVPDRGRPREQARLERRIVEFVRKRPAPPVRRRAPHVEGDCPNTDRAGVRHLTVGQAPLVLES